MYSIMAHYCTWIRKDDHHPDGLVLAVSTLLVGVIAAVAPLPGGAVRTVFEFPNDTYIENLAVRSNGQVLTCDLSKPQLDLFDPAAVGRSKAILVHEFPNSLGLSGIAEYEPDVFAVISGNFSFATGDVGIGSWQIWGVDLRNVGIVSRGGRKQVFPPPKVHLIASVAPAHFLNGISLLSQEHGTLLVGDVNGGAIYRVDVPTGHFEVVLNNTFTAAVPAAPFPLAGVNGVHVRNGDTLYFTNIGKGTFSRVRIHQDGTPAGPITTIAHTFGPPDQFDDFTFDCEGNAFLVTGGGNSIEMITPHGHREVIIAGNVNSTAIAEPTSCAFGRGPFDKNVLYVTTAGGLAVPVDGDEIIGGQLVAVVTRSKGSSC
ncbi:hypothetical protein VTK73DRAFT_4278 [Phialemonium thermophilum]|uniref:SMP-30/Gluconolactonase/LRE-like region domain-containing protein n=1 Tax=Phialemonium thermophilum TaxID=223376 RepID=A0ABR3WU10_9PEZI